MTVDDGTMRRETEPSVAMDPTGQVNVNTEGTGEDAQTAQGVSELEDIRGESAIIPQQDG